MSVLDFLDDELADLTRRDRLRVPRVLRGPQGTHVQLDGRALVSFSSNDYLGLAAHPALRSAAMAELDRSGVGAGASRLIVGNQQAHVELEHALAELFRCEAALLFNSGYAANTGVLPVLAGAPDEIFSDSLNHASIIDGCRLSRARTSVFAHRDLDQLETLLAASTARRKVIVTESIFSMDGDLADLVALRSLADRHGAILMVDEAHAVGVMGQRGGGALEALGIHADVVIGTLGKALGSAGACVCGPASLARLLWNRARSLVFSTAMPASIAAASTAAIRIVRGPEGVTLRSRLTRNLSVLGRAVPSPIVPVLVGEDAEVMRWTGFLMEQGYFVQGIRPPTVPEGTARLRVAVSAAHEVEEVEGLKRLLTEGERVGLRVSRGTSP